MRRRLLILIGSFLAIFLVFLAVSQLSEQGEPNAQRPDSGQEYAIEDQPHNTSPLEQKAEIKYGEVLNFGSRDEQGRIQDVYFARRWDKLDDGTYELITPCFEKRFEDGSRIYVAADRGIVEAEEVAGGISVRGGRLIGNVRAYFDPSTSPDRPTFADMDPERDPGEVFDQLELDSTEMIRIQADDLAFSSDPPRIHTASRVFLWSPDADIVGRGLTLEWHEKPMELRELRIAHGQQISVYNVPEDVNLLAMPGSDEPEETPESVAGERPPKISPAQPDLADRTAPTTAPAEPEPAVAESPTTQPEDLAEVAEPVMNVYLARFEDQVHVDADQRQMRGADELTIRFELSQGAQESLGGRFRTAAEGSSEAAPVDPADGAAETPTTAADKPKRRPAAREPKADRGPSDPITITWRGPLVVRPIEHTPKPSNRRYTIAAKGNDIQLVAEEAEITCRELEFRHPQRKGKLIGSSDGPTRLLVGGEQEVVSPRIRFDIPEGKIYLDGPGRISQAPTTEQLAAATQPADADSDDPYAGIGQAGSIEWAGTMEANFGEFEVTNDDGTTETQQFIKDAVFYENVILSQGPSDAPETQPATQPALPGDFVQCDVLRVWMMTDPSGKIVPEVAVAKGNVSGREAGSNIEAGKVTVFFDSVDELDADGNAEKRLRPAIVTADGDVHIRDERDGQTIEATADRMESDLLEKMAVLHGDTGEATILHNNNLLAGDQIQLDQDRQSAIVRGKGRMRFEINEDFNGNELEQPRPVRITWADGMEYQSQTNAVTFTGEVRLNSELDSMQCEQMRLLFERDESAEEPTEPPTPDEVDRRRRMGMDLERYGNRRLAMIMAHGGVAVNSREEDAAKRLLRRMQLTGEQLMYDAHTQEMTMARSGTLVVEDYRPPEAESEADTESADDSGGMAAGQRPSQSVFQWSKRMKLDQEGRTVQLSGDVQMVHRSGDKVLREVIKDLRVPNWGRLDDGRHTTLHCQALAAQFGEAEEAEPAEVADASKPAGKYEVGPRIGPLELLMANHQVNLTDELGKGTVQVLAERMRYAKTTGTVQAWGFNEGEPIRDAVLTYESSDNPMSFSNPAMLFVMDGTQIVEVRMLKDIYGTGGN